MSDVQRSAYSDRVAEIKAALPSDLEPSEKRMAELMLSLVLYALCDLNRISDSLDKLAKQIERT